MAWNYADIFEAIADKTPPETPALIHAGPGGSEGRVIGWGDFMTRTNRLARHFLAAGVATGDKVAHYMRNTPAYVEAYTAAFKARLVHVNVNFRYLDEELWYILDNSDSRVVVYSAEFREQVRALRARLPGVRLWVEVPPDDRLDADVADFAVSFETLANTGDGGKLGIERSGKDMLFIYTGGTTGMPKGVMWEHEALWAATGSGASLFNPDAAPPKTAEEHADRVAALPLRAKIIPACPLMHGTGMISAFNCHTQGGCVVTTPEANLDADALWKTVQRYKVNTMAIVGDAFAKPMLRSLDAHPGAYDLSSLFGILSSGVMWSPEVKQGLLRHNPNMILVDSFGASEAVGFGRSQTSAAGTSEVAKFAIGEDCKVFTEDHREVEPGSGVPGFIARTGAIPVGYYKDPEKTEKTFPVINGVRYSIPGDWCTVEKDGTLTLLGRGSVCINSGGEKIYPEEVEEVIKTHPQVDDVLVVGVPDEKWGQAVTGVIKMKPGVNFNEEELRGFVRKNLAPYKVPKRILPAEIALRAVNGKADYKSATNFAKKSLGLPV
ncbi:MAG: acyl-CoA synthetase [Alphaproteobacteria bacterium]